MPIINFKKLAKTALREKALLIAEAGYEAIEIEKVISARCQVSRRRRGSPKAASIKKNEFLIINAHGEQLKIKLNDFKRIFIVGIGKGSALAVSSLAEILGEKLTRGIALDISSVKCQVSSIKCFSGTHPLPSKINITATQEIIKLAKGLDEKDLLITFICGGGSALACASEEELKNSFLVTKELMKAGANINELNTVRKHLSEFKGGGLAKVAYPATVISLIISDVCGNDLSNVASGPTVFDRTTKKDAEKILKKYGLKPDKFKLYETPKDLKCFKKTKNILFVCNQDAVMAMMNKAEELGFKPKIYSLALEGEASAALSSMMAKIKTGEALIAAGETTVNLNNGSRIKNYELGKASRQTQEKGGRNQEAVLGAIINGSITDGLVVISFASDAWDNTEAAGAVGDFLTLGKAKKLKLNPEDFLKNHNSFNFFKKTGDLIYAEQKCFNVADLMLVLSLPKE